MVSATSLKRPRITIDNDNDDESDSSASSVELQEAESSEEDNLIGEEPGSPSNMEAGNESDSETDVKGNEGWADSLAKILKTNKPKHKKTLVLSKAKIHQDVVKQNKEEKPSFEIDGEVKEDKPSVEQLKKKTEEGEPKPKKKKEIKSSKVKPNILDKDRERSLSKIATKGVVQLFNAVRNQQKQIHQEVKEAGQTERVKEKVLKSFDKKTFLDVLMGKTKSIDVESQCKPEVKEEAPKWNALRDDFMMKASMKDWDKQLPEEELS